MIFYVLRRVGHKPVPYLYDSLPRAQESLALMPGDDWEILVLSAMASICQH